MKKESDHMRELRSLLWDFQPLPIISMASGCGSLAEKVRVATHASHLVSGTSKVTLSKYMSSVVVTTGDMGVAFRVANVKPMPASMVLPWLPADPAPAPPAVDDEFPDEVVLCQLKALQVCVCLCMGVCVVCVPGQILH